MLETGISRIKAGLEQIAGGCTANKGKPLKEAVF
jgi:hypothetical protein